MRIGLSQRVEWLPERQERRDCLDQAWADLLARAGFLAVPLPNRPGRAREWVQGLGLEGVILTGGNDLCSVPAGRNLAPERDAFERELIAICAAKCLPLLGVCRGMQMLIDYFGGKLLRVEGHVGRPHAVLATDSPVPTLPRAEVNSFHSFGTRPELLPAELLAAGTAPDGTVEAVAHRSLPLRAIMWHPERPVRAGANRDQDDQILIRTLLGGTVT